MHFSHEKHQYYFEKYLRNEMKGEELLAFEKKLLESEAFKSGFDHYVKNRKDIVEEELAEYDQPELLIQKPQKWGWVYTSISLLCLVLIADYYLNANYSATITNGERKKPLIEKINIFKSDPHKNNTPHQSVPVQNTADEKDMVTAPDMPADSNAVEEEWMKYVEGNRMSIQGDYFVFDSIFKVLEAKDLQELSQVLHQPADSLPSDTAAAGGKPKPVGKQLLVEFWDSPIHFNGYLFSGKKLLIYGVEPQTPLYITVSGSPENFHLVLHNKEFQLYSDSQFHKLAEE